MTRHGVCVALMAISALPLKSQDVSSLMRQADSAFEAESRALAQQLYRRVLALDAEQSRAVYRLGVLASSDEDALMWFGRYAALERGDAWGWVAVGDRSLRLGRTVEARDAYQRAATLEPKAKDVQQRLAKARLRAAPVVEPLAGYARDSDGGYTAKVGASGDVALHGGWRVGGRMLRSALGDAVDDATMDEAVLRLEGRPRAAWRVDLSGGPARLAPSPDDSWLTIVGDARARWRAKGAAAELRFRRFALGTIPQLVARRAVQNEGKLGVEIPAGLLRLRAAQRVAVINVTGEEGNRRLQADAIVALPRGWRGEISAQYHRIGYDHASAAGYFAPAQVETIEGGTYWDLGGDGLVSVSIDLGAGVQRIALQGAAVGQWKPALRGWASLSVDLSRTFQWRAEVEAYSAPFAPVGASPSPDWRYGALNMGLQLRLP